MSQQDATDPEVTNRDIDPKDLDTVAGGFVKHESITPDMEVDIVKHAGLNPQPLPP